jgi:hypothetical protein
VRGAPKAEETEAIRRSDRRDPENAMSRAILAEGRAVNAAGDGPCISFTSATRKTSSFELTCRARNLLIEIQAGRGIGDTREETPGHLGRVVVMQDLWNEGGNICLFSWLIMQ